MSPSWRSRLVLGLAPDRLTALRYGPGLTPRQVAHTDVELPKAQSDQPGQWHGALAALPDLLRKIAKPGISVDVVLSNHWVHYAVLPGDPGLRRATDLHALATIVFDKHYGALSREWELKVSPTRRGQPMMASGVPRELLESLRAACSGEVRLRAIQPALMPAANRVRRHLDRGHAIVALIETGRVTVAHCHDGAWRQVISRSGEGSVITALLGELQALHGVPAGGQVWLTDLTGGVTPSMGPQWKVDSFPEFVVGPEHARWLASLSAVAT